MNTTAKFTVASLALLLNPLSPAVEAASQSVALQFVWGAASTGQRAASAVKEAADLLDRARQAMDESNFELADSYITRAEKLAPKYGMFHRGDTPKKAREDLQKRQGKPDANAPEVLQRSKSGLFSKAPPRDPFASRPAADPMADGASEPPAGATVRAATREGELPRWPANAGANPAAAPRSLSPAQGNAMNHIVAPERPAAHVAQAPRANNANPATTLPGKQRATQLAQQSRAALVRGDLNSAEELAMQAQSIAPDSAFGPAEDRPGTLLSEIRSARQRAGNAARPTVVAAGGIRAAENANRGNVVNSVYEPANDGSRNVPVQNLAPGQYRSPLFAQNPTGQYLPQNDRAAEPIPPGTTENEGTAQQFLERGRQALAEGKAEQALALFQQAHRLQDQLDPQARASLQTHLQILSQPQPMGPSRQQPVRPGNMLGTAADSQQALAQRVAADVTRTQTQAKALLQKDPKRALETLQQMRHNLETLLQLDPTVREMQIKRIDMTINETQQYMRTNAAQIELDEQNRAIEQRVEDGQQKRIEIDDRMVALVDEFNRLVDEQRYAEAELVAKKARAMDPENPIVVQLIHESKVLHRLALQQDINERKGDGYVAAITAVEESSIPGDFDIRYPNVKYWQDITISRGQLEAMGNSHLSERERQIEAALKTPVLLKYNQRPLSQVIDELGKLANINTHLDEAGLAVEGQSYDTPVTINLSHEISMKSALQAILQPLRLKYVISNDILNITSGENTKVFRKTYPVGDLVIPIPNFVPDGRQGLNGALEQAYLRSGMSGGARSSLNGTPTVIVADANQSAAPVNPVVNAQWINRPDTPPATGVPQQIPFGPQGPGGLAGGSQADFDSLIDLITSTIAPQTWDSAGGLGSVQEFETNLTLVVSQTQEVHEQIADLLQQLRRLQDLQVTIEVRFIDLSDNFFERIGVDFDFNIDDNFTQAAVPISSDEGRSSVIGLDPVIPLTPTANLDLQFRQGSFQATLPNIPGATFDPATAGTFGFAILSDIEAFFLIQAAQGDDRSNILQAPKITLFNGQTASINDITQRPFVTSLIPVVGDFAAAYQPVIVVLSEGTSLSVQAVVSNDRRFVRLTLVPVFSSIGEVNTFIFEGSRTTTSKSSDVVKAKGDDETSSDDEETVATQGTTVQQPTFSTVSVTSTVSVPDGGTVLLGGIKRLSENRAERGLPILSKIPYINRLFKNVGLSRSTRSLMMMVTPRIIIQEEEEEKLIGTAAP